MTRIEKNELISVLEGLRISQHPELPANLIEEIVSAEFSTQDDRSRARKDTQKIIDDYLKTITV